MANVLEHSEVPSSASASSRGKRKATAAAMPRIAEMIRLLAADSDADECIVLDDSDEDVRLPSFVPDANKKSKQVHRLSREPPAVANAQNGDDARGCTSKSFTRRRIRARAHFF